MWASDAAEKIRELLGEKAAGRLSMEELGLVLGVDPTQAGRFLNGVTRADLAKVLRMIEALEMPKAHFFRMALEEEKFGPAQVLACYREDPEAEIDAFVLRYDSLTRILEPLPGKAQPSPRRDELLQLEDLRFSDPLGAKARLEELAGEFFGITESALPPAELLGDLAAALAIWASLMRLRSRRDDAIKAFELAFRLGERGGENWILGLLNQKAAYLLMDLSATEVGIEFLDRALKYFILSGDAEWQAKVYVDYGVLYHYLGQSEEAIRWLVLGIANLPESSRRYRFAAYHNIASALEGLGRYAEAAAAMEKALELRPNYALAEASLRWAEAALLLAAGEVAKAIDRFGRARSIYFQLENWAECAFVTVEMAKALFRSNDKKGLAELTGETLSLAKKLRKHQASANLLVNFALDCRRGCVAEPLLKALAEKLKEAFPERSRHLDQN